MDSGVGCIKNEKIVELVGEKAEKDEELWNWEEKKEEKSEELWSWWEKKEKRMKNCGVAEGKEGKE